jgi:peptidoglycan/xylan/chitin deacetylase (PgdA/CDA1 family)
MSTLIWKRRIGRVWGGFLQERPRKVILLYHSVGESPLAVSEIKFRQQMAWLSKQASIVPIHELLNGPAMNGLQVAISFDDGYSSLYERVGPILSEYGATATLYLNTGCIGAAARKASDSVLGHYPDEYFLTWDEVAALAKAGWTIGSHGAGHLDLTRQEPAIVARELLDSKREIESRLGQPCEHFSYTWGRFTPELQRAVKESGYRNAVSGLHGPVSAASDRFALPRIDIRSEYELRDFADVVTGHWDYLGLKQRLTRRLA